MTTLETRPNSARPQEVLVRESESPARSSAPKRTGSAGIRVLHLSSWKTRCGIADYCANFVNALEAAGVESDVFALNRENTRFLTDPEMKALVGQFLEKARDFDVVHIQHEFGLFVGSGRLSNSIRVFRQFLKGLRSMGKPVVVTFHTEPFAAFREPKVALHPRTVLGFASSFFGRNRWGAKISPLFSRRSKRATAIAHSRYSRLALTKSGFSHERIRVIPHAIIERTNPWLERQAEAKRSLNLPDDAIVLSMFGFVAKYKGPLFAAKVLRQLPPNYHLLVIGGPHPEDNTDTTFNKILQQAGDASLRDRLRVTGYADKATIDLCQGATDICLVPYLRSTLLSASGAIAWALTSGRPVMASKIPAFVEISQTADCLALVTPEAPFEWVWAIQRLAANHAEKERLVANAKKYATNLSWKNVTDQIVAEYRQMLGKTAPATR
ncbi:MAG: glycosyltransferase [Phycisphaerales bacterium]